MAAPAFVAASAIGSSTAGSFSIVLPTHSANDVLWVISWYRASATVATPAGWTEAATALRGTTRYYLHWIRAADANTADPLFDYTGADDGFGLCVVYSGCITTGNPYDVLGAFSSGTAQSAVLTGITALTNESLIVASIGGEDNTATGGPTTGTDPATYVEHYVEAATGTDGCVQIAEQAQTTTGATGDVTVAWSATVVGWGGWVAALIPPTSAPVTATPGTAALILTAFVPIVTATMNQLVTAGAFALSLNAFAATALTPVVETPGTIALSITTFAPDIGIGVTATPGTFALGSTRFAPTVTVTANQVATPGLIAHTLSAFTPTITTGVLVTIGPLQLGGGSGTSIVIIND